MGNVKFGPIKATTASFVLAEGVYWVEAFDPSASSNNSSGWQLQRLAPDGITWYPFLGISTNNNLLFDSTASIYVDLFGVARQSGVAVEGRMPIPAGTYRWFLITAPPANGPGIYLLLQRFQTIPMVVS